MQNVQTDKAPAAIGPYSQAIVCGGLVYTSGQIPLSPATGQIIGEDIASQTEMVIRNLEAVLHAAGSSLADVVKSTCFLTDLSHFEAFNAVYGKHFISRPARSCVQVSALPKGALVEIEVIARYSEQGEH